ncbi:hypothetical protein GCM10020331_009090 [Ectobacillus funiculus]
MEVFLLAGCGKQAASGDANSSTAPKTEVAQTGPITINPAIQDKQIFRKKAQMVRRQFLQKKHYS